MRIVFAGTPEVALPTLRQLVSSEHEVVAVLTRPDAPLGRKKVLTPSPVASLAQELNIPVIHASRITEEITDQLLSLNADLGVVVAYGALLPQGTLDLMPHGWINLHFSALPEWRGAAPVQWQVMSGATRAGSSVFSLVPQLDAGDVYDIQTVLIEPTETSGELLSRLSQTGATQVLDVVDAISEGCAIATPQQGSSTYARKLTSEDGHLDLSLPAPEVFNQYRGVTPEPGAFVLIEGQRFKVLLAQLEPDINIKQFTITSFEKEVFLGCSSGALRLDSVQPFGKAAMSAADWFRGTRQEEVSVS